MTTENLDHGTEIALAACVEYVWTCALWMTNLSEPFWNGDSSEWAELYHPIARLLFSLGFIGCGTPDGRSVTYFYDDPEFLERVSNLTNTQGFLIHPAFRAALDTMDNVAKPYS